MAQNETCAVVVTYNRIPMLKKCLEHLCAQTVPCDVWVVDNASSDGTAAYLQAQVQAQPSLHWTRCQENLGGAGGFHVGIAQAAARQYRWIWVMDDDCLPAPTALERLLGAQEQLHTAYGWLSSRVMWTDGTPCRMNIQRMTPYRDVKLRETGLIPAAMASFVSLLLPRETVEKYGLPCKEFFIWADDWEYTRRISRHAPCYVAADSVAVHAMEKNAVVDISREMDAARIARYAYAYRNDVALYRREGWRGWCWLVAKDVYHTARLLLRRKPGRIPIIWRGFWRGLSFHPAAAMGGEEP